jgi:DNA-directed RNA polymerase subunit M/transcription elongation factor TFIIS
MRLCKCGGMVAQHQLSNDREAWTCRSCGRYEIIEQKKSEVESSEPSDKTSFPEHKKSYLSVI